MNRLLLVPLLLPLVSAWPSEQPVAPQPPADTVTMTLNGHHFTLPAGFIIELVAGPPLVNRPVAMDFDDDGHLYVTEVSGTNEKVADQLKKKPHRVLRLDPTGADGKFTKATVFADQMMFPEGIMVYKGSVYVAAPPSIWKLTDTDGKGVANQRVEWFDGKTLTGCANDLHGPYLGPDGWIYWCKGAFATQTYERPGKAPFVTRAAHIFRARPDGSGIEPVMTGGMDNPVDVVFTPGGERLFTTTFLQYPAGGKRDGIIHAVYGGVYGKEFHDVIDKHPWTGPSVLPPLVHLGAAAPCGLHRYESDALGANYQDNVFACCFNLRKVTRHILIPDGATFKTQDFDFLVSDNPDFHPTDVIEDADGSLLVIDTGGWYKLCCPTTQLVRPEALGGIYRIRKKDSPKVDDPRGHKIGWKELSHRDLGKLLDDPRPFVRKRAVQALADKGTDACETILHVLDTGGPRARLHAVWAATRIESKAARFTVRQALSDLNDTVRCAAIHSAGAWRDAKALFALTLMLDHKSLHVRRAAAEALGRLGDKAAVPALFKALAEPGDRVLEHSLIYALIEIAHPEATTQGLESRNPRIRRAALIALDQMPAGGLEAKAVARELASADAALKEAAWWIAGRHPDWGGHVAGYLREQLAAREMSLEQRAELVKQLARFARGGPVQELLTERVSDPKALNHEKRLALRAMAQAGLKQPPEAWAAALAALLAGDDLDLVQEAIRTANTWRDPKQPSDKLAAALVQVGGNDKLLPGIRLAALAAVPGGLKKVEAAQFDLLRAHLGTDQPVPLRTAAADALARAKLTPEQLRALTKSLHKLGPMELNRVLDAYTGCTDDAVGTELVAALKTADARSGLRVETLQPRLAKFGPAVQKEAAALCASLRTGAAERDEHVSRVLKSFKDGDVTRGRAVFNSQKAACFSCHAIGYLGGNVGPDLTHIARVRTERDLVESILYPSASFVRGYEPVVVTTKSGKVYNGVVRRDAPDEIVLATGVNEEVRIAREAIDEMQPSQVSVMPAGYAELLTAQELVDLVAFLKACK